MTYDEAVLFLLALFATFALGLLIAWVGDR